MRSMFAVVSLVVAMNGVAQANDIPADAGSVAAKKTAVVQYLTPKLPADWSVHVTQDDETLIAYLWMPIQRAFELAYRPEDTDDILSGLCPAPDQAIWSALGPGTKLDLEPVANGKGFFRMHCIRGKRAAKAHG